MSNYPRDEFDEVPENSARHGVHRASMELPQRSLLPVIIVTIVALCIGLLAFFVMPGMFNTSANASDVPPAAGTSAAAPAVTPETVPTEDAPPSVEPSAEFGPSAAATPSAAPTSSAAPKPTVDRAVPVAIYNATGVSGLAARYASTVITSGWTVSQSTNWAGLQRTNSVIFYQDETQVANAQALAALLNIPTVVETADIALPLTVVLGPDA